MHYFWKKAEYWSVRLVPASATLFMVFFAAVLGKIPGFNQIMPMFTLINIYYWCVFYPRTLPYWFLFILGILQDTLTGVPLGFSSFFNIVFAWLLINKFRVFRNMSFAIVWLRFIILSVFVTFLQWFIMAIYYGNVMPVGTQIMMWLSSCFAYPIVHFLLTLIYRPRHA